MLVLSALLAFRRELILAVRWDKPFFECLRMQRNCQGLYSNSINILIGISIKDDHFRITGLDPAGPLFKPNSTVFLTKEDAEFVDVIHTDSGFYGTSKALASVDFYPNDGVRAQSGCSIWTFPFSSTRSGVLSIYDILI